MMENRPQRRFMSEINVVPLVDVVLVLLVIFMITAPMLYRGIDIKLPQSASNTIKSTERIILTVGKNQVIYVNKDKVKLSDLRKALEKIKDENPGATVYLRGDEEVKYGVVVKVMDIVKRVGIEKLGMVTQPAGDSPS